MPFQSFRPQPSLDLHTPGITVLINRSIDSLLRVKLEPDPEEA
jgi:hypothetical protein